MSDLAHREEILRIGRMLHDRSYIAASDGNISVRLNDHSLLVTPTCMSKGMLAPEDLVVVDRNGQRLSGFRNVSSEVGLHLMIYRVRPDVNAIVHAHPPVATSFAAAGIALDQSLISEIVLALGSVPLAQYATPGSQALSDNIEPHIRTHDAVLMANHGVVTCAHDLMQAYMHMETVEHFAKIALVTHQLGCPRFLPEDEVRRLSETRERLKALRNCNGHDPASK